MVYLRKNKFPKVDDLVIARITHIDQYGIRVELPEYNDINGYITYNEVSRKKKKDINKIISIGKEVLMIVINYNEEKGHMDLSKRTIDETEEKLFFESYRIYMDLYNRFRYLYIKLNNYENIDIINQDTVNQDKFYNYLCATLFEIQDEYDNNTISQLLYDSERNESVFEHIDYDKIQWTQEQFKTIMDNYITLKTVKTKASENIQIRLLSYDIDGNNDIKYALNFVEFPSFSEISKEFEIQINYISASTYLILINQKDYGDCDLENIKNILINDIKKRTDERKIMFDYKK